MSQKAISPNQHASGRVVRDRIELSTFRFSGGRSYQLSYLTVGADGTAALPRAVLTGFEPATSTLTGWRALLAALQDLASASLCQQVPPTGFEPVPPP